MAPRKKDKKKFVKQKRTKAMRERFARSKEAAIKKIAREEKITQKEARRIYKNVIIETIFTRPARSVRRRFVEISPGNFGEVPKGKKLSPLNVEGDIRTLGYVKKVIKQRQYWEFVRLMAEEYGTTIAEARRYITKKKKEGDTLAKIIWLETGVSP